MKLTTPLGEEVLDLTAGDRVLLSGTVYTARDEAHLKIQEAGFPFNPKGAVLYHCGPVIQDNAVVHTDKGYIVEIGSLVTIGHGAIIHGCSIGDNSLIGMGAIILNGAKVGNNCIVGAGALITKNTIIPDNSLVLGSPAKVIRQVTPEEIQASIDNAKLYIEERLIYAENEKNCNQP